MRRNSDQLSIYYVYADQIAFHKDLQDARRTMVGWDLISELGITSSQRRVRSHNGNSRLQQSEVRWTKLGAKTEIE
jgi:hypothetical protein